LDSSRGGDVRRSGKRVDARKPGIQGGKKRHSLGMSFMVREHTDSFVDLDFASQDIILTLAITPTPLLEDFLW
jgi:hypothetical protein